MNVLNQSQVGAGQYLTANISALNTGPFDQFWAERTAIWTFKYGEKTDVDGIERDKYDVDSSIVVQVAGSPTVGTVIAGCRLIHATRGRSLPVNSCSDFPITGRAVEVSRFFFSPLEGTSRDEGEQLLKLFIHGLVVYLKGLGYDRAYATIRASLFAKLVGFGIPMERIGKKQVHGIREFIPAMMFEQESLLVQQTNPQERLAA